VKLLSPSLPLIVALTLASVAAPALATAQPAAAPAASTRYQVAVVRLKADMINEWLDLQRTEVVPALKKAGVKERQVWANSVGNGFEYTILTPFEKWALLDGPGPLVRALGDDGAARLNAKLRKCIEVQRTFMTNRVDDLNVAPPGNALVMRTVVRRIQPGKMQEYQGMYRSDILPGLKKAKADGKLAGSTFAVRGAGAQTGEFTTTEYFNKFADLDGPAPLVAAIGQEAVNKINARAIPLATTVQTIVRRRIADLGF
jgi:hypothetical protein